jgi:hypothetical protein
MGNPTLGERLRSILADQEAQSLDALRRKATPRLCSSSGVAVAQDTAIQWLRGSVQHGGCGCGKMRVRPTLR